ncbi:FmdB family zinc ribbon protein [Cryobacterium sp. HLT2-28]|uniref:FmdB family zinc ribbon protein n=1 Tax=Cryobacterium sp. HLT2-28 TaxID=1259146 RepID=UPI00106C998B|nr:zinc ribbon domain-containing protein [Cryobacterium sp. HLT2-28]TFB91656.1 zinc ribbon domain-containing protein [Cryobacterium sp. HLT2-28]
MPIYEYRCAEGQEFEVILPMGLAPDLLSCPTCQGTAKRRMSAPTLSLAGTSAYKLIDSANRSAHEPTVVDSRIPGVRAGTPQLITTNPLHRKLPRP